MGVASAFRFAIVYLGYDGYTRSKMATFAVTKWSAGGEKDGFLDFKNTIPECARK